MLKGTSYNSEDRHGSVCLASDIHETLCVFSSLKHKYIGLHEAFIHVAYLLLEYECAVSG